MEIAIENVATEAPLKKQGGDSNEVVVKACSRNVRTHKEFLNSRYDILGLKNKDECIKGKFINFKLGKTKRNCLT